MLKPTWLSSKGFFVGSSRSLMGQSIHSSSSLRFGLFGCILSVILCLMVSCTGVTKATSATSNSSQTPGTPPPVGGGGTPPPNPTPVPIVPGAIPPTSSNIAVFPGSVAVYPGTYQTVTAIVSNVDNKNVSWSTDGGALVGTNPCTDSMTAPCTIALYNTQPGTYHVTATSLADGQAKGTATITVVPAPTPVTTHPRLYFTQADIPTLRAKAVSGNEAWTALQTLANGQVAKFDTGWSTSAGGGGYTCDGGNGQPSSAFVSSDESVAWGGPEPGRAATIFALMANVDPNATNRARWQCRAHDAYLYYMNEILKTNCGSGICNPTILNGNQGADWSNGIGLTYDWIYSSFSPSDKAVILNAWRKAAKMIATQEVISSSHPNPVGAMNDARLASDASYAPMGTNAYGYLRTTGNNYFSLHLTQLASMGAAIDASDDPAQSSCAGDRFAVCGDGSANSIQAYLKYSVGAYLYLLWLNQDDPAITTSAYNNAFGSQLNAYAQCSGSTYASVPTACFGSGRGALSQEGSMYMGSITKVRDTFNFLHTAGLDNPLNFAETGTAMPQLSFATSSWWDVMTQGVLHLTTPNSYACCGTKYPTLFSYNEINSTYDNAGFPALLFGQLLRYDQMTGRSDRNAALGWLFSYLPSTYSSFTSLAGVYPDFITAGFFFSPTGSTIFSSLKPSSDPRNSMPPDFWSLNSGVLLTGTGWGAKDTVFSSLCSIYPTQDHELGTCGRFSLYRNGDFITKGVDGYAENDNSGNLSEEQPDYSNLAAYQNSPSGQPSGLWYIDPLWQRGGQPNHGMGSAANIVIHNEMPSYVFQHLDQTGGYNFTYPRNPKLDVQHASRSFFWVKRTSGSSLPDYLVVYDRGETGQSGFKKVWFIATGDPTISGSQVSWNTPLNKATAYLHNLLPAGAAVSNHPFESFPLIAQADKDYAPKTRILVDAGTPTSVRFLNVLEAEDFGAPSTGASLVQSTSGTPFDGAAMGTSAVVFKRNMADSFAMTSFDVPGSVKQIYVTGLSSNAFYGISMTSTGTKLAVTITTGGSSKSDSVGVLAFTAQ